LQRLRARAICAPFYGNPIKKSNTTVFLFCNATQPAVYRNSLAQLAAPERDPPLALRKSNSRHRMNSGTPVERGFDQQTTQEENSQS